MIRPPVPRPVERAGAGIFRGAAFSLKEVNAYIRAGGLQWNMLMDGKTTKGKKREGDYQMTDITPEYEKANQVISNAQAAYNKTLDQFRSTVKNDLASISASADRVQRENEKMRSAYEAAAGMLTSPEMEKAIANAERLATALQAISALQNHSITFAVLDKKTPTRPE